MLVWLWGLSDGALYQFTQNARFSREAAGSDFGIARNTPVAEASPRPGVSAWIAPVLPKRDPLLLGRIEIPSIQLTVMVREGVDATSLRKAAGHLPSSALPGQAGNVVVLGHRDTFFRPLRGIAQGDPIRVKTPNGSFQYIVDSIQVVAPEQSLAFREDMPAEVPHFDHLLSFRLRGTGAAALRGEGPHDASELDPSVHGNPVKSPLERMP